MNATYTNVETQRLEGSRTEVYVLIVAATTLVDDTDLDGITVNRDPSVASTIGIAVGLWAHHGKGNGGCANFRVRKCFRMKIHTQ
jgi:hypothetical protein